MDLTALFCDVDDFVKAFIQSKSDLLITWKKSSRGTSPRMSLAEIITIVIAYHSSGFKNFKSYYFYLMTYQRSAFPKLIS